MMSEKITERVYKLVQQEVKEIIGNLTGAVSVVVSTVDGFEVAYAHLGVDNSAKVAAMSSSISSIASVVAEEYSIGMPSNIVIFSEGGFIQVFIARREDVTLIINIACSSAGILGQATYRGNKFVKTLMGL